MITYTGHQTKKIIKCFNKYDVGIAINKGLTVFDQVKNNSVEETPVLHKTGVYKLTCKECNKETLKGLVQSMTGSSSASKHNDVGI